MKIVIDARFLGSEGAGIGKYTDKLLANLSELDKDNHYIVLLKKSNFHLFNPSSDNFEKRLIDAHWYSLKEQILVPLVLAKEKPDLVHFLHINVPILWKGNFLVTIHDLIFEDYGQQISKSRIYHLKKQLYDITLNQVVNSSKKIITPSNYVKNKLVKRFKISKDKVVVTHEAADEVFFEAGKREVSPGEKSKILSTFGIKEPFILTVGNSYPYKNISGVLGSITYLPENLSLVHVSGRGPFSEDLIKKAREERLEKRLILTGVVSSEDLALLYKLAQVFVFPSLSEGFGLPGLEAMATGCPVVCSDIEVFKEIYGEGAQYFNPKDSKDMAEKIKIVTTNPILRTQLTVKGLEQVKKYSWKRLAQETLEVYNSI